MSSIQDILLEVNKNNLLPESKSSESSNIKTIYNEKDFKQVKNAVEYYGKRKTAINNIIKAGGELEKLERIRKDYVDAVAIDKKLAKNGIATEQQEKEKADNIQQDVIKMKKLYQDFEHKVTELNKLKQRLPNNKYTKSLDADPLQKADYDVIIKKSHDYNTNTDPSQNQANVLEKYLHERNKIIKNSMKLWEGKTWNDFSKKIPLNLIIDPHAAQTALQQEKQDNAKRKIALTEYESKLGQAGNSHGQLTLDDIKRKPLTEIETGITTLQTVITQNNNNASVLAQSIQKYKQDFGPNPDVLAQITGLQHAADVNQAYQTREKLILELQANYPSEYNKQGYKNFKDNIIKQLNDSRSQIFKDYLATYGVTVGNSEKQLDNGVLNDIIKERRTLIAEAQKVFSTRLIDRENKNNKDNGVFKGVVNVLVKSVIFLVLSVVVVCIVLFSSFLKFVSSTSP